MVLFVSSGEIFIILLVILIFFGADKIPEFTRMMGKGVREFKKATDDIKREFHESSSGIVDEIKSIGNDVTAIGDNLTDTFTKEIAEPMQDTANEAEKTFKEYANEAEKTFDEYSDQYNADYYYNHPNDTGYHGNEYGQESQASESMATEYGEEPPTSENIVETPVYGQSENAQVAEPAVDTTQPAET